MPEVNLVKKVKTEAGWRFVPVEYHANGKVKPDSRPHTFYLEWRQDGKRKREAVGKIGFEAIARRQRKQRILAAQEAGIQVTDPDQPRGTNLAGAIETYLEDILLTKKPKTHAAYKSALDYFAESCKKQTVEEIDRRDLLQYTAFLRDKKQSPRSVYNKFEIVMTFLKARADVDGAH